jgi:two-component system sensor histidine kinase RegB
VLADGLVLDDPADRWLVVLRWVAVAGMGASIFVSDWIVAGLDVTNMTAVLLAIAAGNLVWMALLARVVPLPRGASGEPAPPRRWVEAQLVVDVVSLGAMLWFAGGLTNPFAPFLVLQIGLAGVLCTPRATLWIAALTGLITVALAFARELPPISSALHTSATVACLVSLSALLAAFGAIYAQRLSQLRSETARNEKLAVLGRLVGSMSHELNTPLATILLSSRDLRDFADRIDDAERTQLVATIVREAERANDIVGLVRGHVGPDQAAEPVELAGFVERIAGEELDRLGFEGERRFVLDRGLVAPVMKRALVQVLANLLRNACEASPLGRRRRISVSVRREGGRVEVGVEDRGPGFSPEILGRLGEPFQTTKGDRGGMGLGIYVSAMLAKQMGSRLEVGAAPGGGARVVLSLPIDEGGAGASSGRVASREGEAEVSPRGA